MSGWSPRAWGLALLTVLSMLRACVATSAEAQSTEVLVARTCWSESRDDAHECRAIVHVLAERSRLYGGSVRASAQAYAPRATGRRPYPGREWIAALEPDALPDVEGVSREWVRVRFAALVHVTWRALRGLDEPVCPRAWHWAAPWCGECRERMEAAGLVRLPCNAGNHFYGRVR